MHSADRIPGLDLLRALAVVWVMLFHSFLVGGLGPDWEWLTRFGWMGVDLFFVLSGFLIGSQVLAPLAEGRRLSLGDFYVRRAFRILPAYLAVLALYLAWPGFRERPGMEAPWKFLLFVVNLSIDYTHNAAFSHAWSLCVEEHFYWLFPLAALLLMRRPAFWTFALLCVAVVFGGILLRAGIWMHHAAIDPTMSGGDWFIEDIYYPTWNRLDGLLFGVILASWKTLRPASWQRARRHADAALLGGLVTLAIAFGLFADRIGLLGNAIGWPILSLAMALLVFAAAGRDSLLGRHDGPLIGWLATTSYSLYLIHKPIYHLLQTTFGDALAHRGVVAVFTYGLASLLAGAALHYGVERPFLRLRRHLSTRSAHVTVAGS